MGTSGYHRPLPAHHPLLSTHPYGSSSGEGEAGDKVCEAVDDPVGFKSDAWKHFGFNKWERRKGEGQTGDNTQSLLD